MGSIQRRERERVELRGKILDAARELFASEGYESVTMRKIAERIEYSPTAIYSHFKDKEALLWELCEGDFLTLAHELQTIGQVEDPVERLGALGRAYLKFASSHPNHYRLMFMTPLPPHDHSQVAHRGDPAQDAYAFLRATVVEAIEAGRLRPELQSADLVSQTLWAGVHGLVSLHIAKCNQDWVSWCPEKERVDLMLEAMMRGLVRQE